MLCPNFSVVLFGVLQVVFTIFNLFRLIVFKLRRNLFFRNLFSNNSCNSFKIYFSQMFCYTFFNAILFCNQNVTVHIFNYLLCCFAPHKTNFQFCVKIQGIGTQSDLQRLITSIKYLTLSFQGKYMIFELIDLNIDYTTFHSRILHTLSQYATNHLYVNYLS